MARGLDPSGIRGRFRLFHWEACVAVIRRPARTIGIVATAGLALAALCGQLPSAAAAAVPAGPRFAAIQGSVTPVPGPGTGAYRSSRMTIEVALQPRDPAGLSAILSAQYRRGSAGYHQWLGKGQFDARFAPAAATTAAVAGYLTGRGLTVQRSGSPFLVRASGSSRLVSAAFRTTLRTYRSSKGAAYFANATAVQVPAQLAPDVLSVLGLSDTLGMHSAAIAVPSQPKPYPAAQTSSPGSCQSPYPTVPLLVQGVLSGISSSLVPRGYGGGPGCSGLTPAQVNSIYTAPVAGPRAKGAGVTMAVFELSAYQQSDVDTWAHTFYGPQYTPPLTDINVDGGPQTPACPAGDACVPGSEAYFYDIEPAGDIEMQLAIAPDVRRIDVYNAPEDALGITELDEYHQIAADDTASVVSTSWGLCEDDAGSAYEQAQNVIFEQMAAQGQSVFAAAGDTGPYGCIRNDGPAADGVNVWDPAAQPWVTAVGGTSMESFNPMANPQPAYSSQESVWNVDGLCNSSANEGSPLGQDPPITGYDWCAITLAGGGGSSNVFGRPAYQVGRGVKNPYTTIGCALASAGTPCREIPDVSANADEFTPYAEYCTGNASTPGSYCAGFTAQPDPGWVGFAGTSAAAPLWAGIAADRDSWQGARSGNLNPLLYLLYNLAPNVYFHDITGTGQATSNNGLFPAVPGYDEATGVGTPRMAALITGTL